MDHKRFVFTSLNYFYLIISQFGRQLTIYSKRHNVKWKCTRATC